MSLQTFYTNPANLVGRDATAISAATVSVDFAAYTLTEPTIINALLGRARAGIKVRLYLDRSELEAEARGNPTMPNCPLHLLFGVPNLAILVKKSMVLMHLKSYCVDSKALRDGSANFSPIGVSEQDNSVTYTDDPAALAAFAAKFEAMWTRPDNLTVAEAVEGYAVYGVHHTHSH
jgi:phosphatidylserine/phosphatidylglycerophosphate/cardiolipin synthase-like enzyme